MNRVFELECAKDQVVMAEVAAVCQDIMEVQFSPQQNWERSAKVRRIQVSRAKEDVRPVSPTRRGHATRHRGLGAVARTRSLLS